MTKEEIIQYLENLRQKLDNAKFWEHKYMTKETCIYLFDKILEDIKKDS